MSRQIGDIPTRTFNPGDVIFKEGDDPKGEAFIVHIGTVEIKKLIAGEQRLLNTVRKGSLLGEFGLFRDAPRSATAIATDAVTLMVISANRLDHMVRSNPALAAARCGSRGTAAFTTGGCGGVARLRRRGPRLPARAFRRRGRRLRP